MVSGDPSRVLAANRLTDLGTTATTTGNDLGLFVDCVVDAGGADLTLTAPGYPPKVVRANCYPATVRLSAGSLRFDDDVYSTSLFGGPIRVFPQAEISKTGPPSSFIVAVRPGAEPITVEVSPLTITLGSRTQSFPLLVQPMSLGTTTIGFRSPRIVQPRPAVVRVDQPES